MYSVIKRRFSTDLMISFSAATNIAIVDNDIRLFDSWFVDMRDFVFFMPGYIKDSPKMNIRTYNFDLMGTTFYGPKYITNPGYGYYSLDFSQAEEKNLHIWV